MPVPPLLGSFKLPETSRPSLTTRLLHPACHPLRPPGQAAPSPAPDYHRDPPRDHSARPALCLPTSCRRVPTSWAIHTSSANAFQASTLHQCKSHRIFLTAAVFFHIIRNQLPHRVLEAVFHSLFALNQLDIIAGGDPGEVALEASRERVSRSGCLLIRRQGDKGSSLVAFRQVTGAKLFAGHAL